MAKVLALAVVILGLVGGAAAGLVLRPPPPQPAEGAVPEPAPPEAGAPDAVQLRDPFIVPVLEGGVAWSHAVLSLGVESARLSKEAVLVQEPRLRDGLNEALYLHGSLGGFEGDFTTGPQMARLRERLNDVVIRLLDDPGARVLLIAMTRRSD